MQKQKRFRISDCGLRNKELHRISPFFLASSETPKRDRPILKTTGEQIVREFRKEGAGYKAHPLRGPEAGGVGQTEILKPKPFKLAWYKAVNWKVVSDFGCWIGVGVAVGYLVVKVFVPFLTLIQVLKFGR